MKKRIRHFSKSTLSLILSLCMLVSCVSVGLIATDAARVKSDELVGGWDWNATYKMGSNVSGGWDGAGQTATVSDNMVSYDFYFTHNDTHTDGEVRFAFYQDGSWDSRVTPSADATSIDGENNKKNCTYGNSDGRGDWYWVYKPEWLSDDGKYYKVTMNLDMQDNYNNGKMWFTTTALAPLSPQLTVPTNGVVGTAISLTGNSTDTGKVGTLTKTYQYSTDNGTTWMDLTGGSYTATTAGTVKFRYKVADGGITSQKAYALSDRVEYSEVKSCAFSAPVVPSLDSFTIDGAASKTLNIGEEATLASTKSHTDNEVTYSTASDAISITGTTVKALKPVSSATITATLVDGETYTKTVTVKVNTPALTMTYDPATILTGGATTKAPTVAATGANASSEISNKTFTITSGGTSGTVANDGKVTSTSTAGTVTVQVTGTVSHNGVSYTSATGTANITVQEPASVYFKYDQSGGTNTKRLDGTKMAYDNSLNLYKLSVDLEKGTEGNWYYIVVYDASEGNNLSHYDQVLTEELRSGNGHTLYSGNNEDYPIHLVATVTGTYNFYFDAANNTLYVEYPHTVTFNMNNHGDDSDSQVITYGGKATKPADPTATGYAFGGWYKESECTNAFDFNTDTITADTTLYAKWTALPQLGAPDIKYNNAATTPVTMDAAEGSKARITWAAVNNAGSYEIFKDGNSLGTTTNLYFDIERGNSHSGTYTVKAIPSNAAAHSPSNASNSIQFTFNKVQLTAPVVAADHDWVLHGHGVTFSISGGSSTATLGTDFNYQRTAADGTSYADVSGSSWSTENLTNTTDVDKTPTFKFKAVALKTDYFASSSETSKQITVKPSFGVDAGSTATFAPGSATEMDYDANQGYYFLAVSLISTADYYFRLNQMGADPKWAGDWNGNYPNVHDVVVDGEKVAAATDVSGWDNKASLHYSGSSKKIIIWFNYAAKQVWIEGNSTKYTVTFSQPSSDGSSIKVENSMVSPQTFYEDDTANYSITAGSGYVIIGVTANGETIAVDRQTSYTGSFSVTQNTSISATIVRQYSITKNTAAGGSYTVKRGTQEVTSFIAGDELTLTATPAAHYDFTKLEVTGGKSATITGSPATLETTGANGDITITPTFTAKSYTYTTEAKYSTTGGADSTYTNVLSGAATPSSGTATNVSGVNITAADVDGYAFYKWIATGGSVSIPSAKSTTFKPAENNAKATALYKKVYTVTTNSPEGGTVTVSKTNPVAGESYTVTVVASDGYKFKKLTVGGNDVTSSVSNGSYTAAASGTNGTIAVVAEFEINTNMKLFIGGRFRVRPSEGAATWTNSFNSSDWGQEENIQFTYDHDTLYKVETYASPQELSASFKNAGDGTPLPSWFYVYDKTNNKTWHPAVSNADLTDADRTVALTSNDTTHNVKFNSNSTDTPVTIYYNTNTHALTYTMPEHYNVKVLSSDGGTVTAVPNRAVAGTEINLTVSPDVGYRLSGITAKRDDDQQEVTVANNKFSMPASDVTVTPVFEKIPYTLYKEVNHGSISFYSDSECQTAITTATYQQVVYVKYTPDDGYMLQSFTVSGTNVSGITMDSDTVGHFTMGTSAATVTAHEIQQSDVTYYIDMHDNKMSKGNTVLVELLQSNDTPYTYSGNKACSATLTADNRQEDSTVYAVNIPTPLDVNSIKIRVTYNGTPYPLQELNVTTVAALRNNTQKEVWLEAVNESSLKQDSKMQTHTEKSVAADKRRIYLAKPTSISGWTTVGIYYWGSESTASFTYKDIAHMDFLGNDANNYYYRVDVPKGVDNFLFCGWNKGSSDIGANDKPDSQTGNIESTSATGNFYTLSFSNNSYHGNKENDVKIADYTRYVSEIYSNIMPADATSNISIAPTLDKASAGSKVTYQSDNTDQVTVTKDGIITPKASTVENSGGYVNVTVTIYSTIGERITTGTSVHDYWTYNVKVYVHDPSKLDNFYVMSLESITYTVNIPKQNNGIDQPGYFDYDTENDKIRASVVVTGIQGVASASNSAIIEKGDTVNVTGVGTSYTSYTVKYAKSNSDFNNYDAITLTGAVTTKSIHRDGERYGFDHWESNDDPVTYKTFKSISPEGIETVETTAIAFDPDYTTYSAIFVKYQYVDVNFTFVYEVYKPQEVIYNKETGLEATVEEIANDTIEKETKINYPYDAAYAATQGSHETVEVPVKGYEVRGKVSPGNNSGTIISSDNLIVDAMKALGSYTKNNTETLLLNNNYYDYQVVSTGIAIGNSSTYTANVTVTLKKIPKQYHVYLWNGSKWVEQTNPETNKVGFSYQAYADVSATGGNKVKWYAVSEDVPSTANAPLLANDTSYRFRVKGDTYLVTEAGIVSDKEFNRSEVDFSHYEIVHKEKVIDQNPQMIEYLRQNFYIADFFAPAKVFDPSTAYEGENEETKYLPYDEVNFVGGGVVYYSVKDDVPFSNAVSAGYVDGDTGKVNPDAIKEMLKTKIEAQYAEDNLAGAIGEEDAMKVAYGTEIPVTKNIEGGENGFNTGIIYRYLPLETYARDGQGKLVKDKDGNYTLAKTTNVNTFRYSNTLQSYQYVYASGNENKATNNGKNMRLYSYYVYSYLTYDQDTNLPETKYEIVLSDNYADASTYWAGN